MALRITVDWKDCQGHARCAAKAPDLFNLDDLGYIVPGDRVIAPEVEKERSQL